MTVGVALLIKRSVFVSLMSVFFLMNAYGAAAATEQNVVVGTVDNVLTADIFTMQTENGQIFVHLAGIDTPDIKQTFGKEAHKVLSDLIYKKVLVLRAVGLDPCGRTVAMAWINGDNGLDISSQMILNGAAWVYRRYTDSPYLLTLEAKAQKEKKGLWALDEKDREAPWEWRKQMRLKGYEPVSSCRIAPHDENDPGVLYSANDSDQLQ